MLVLQPLVSLKNQDNTGGSSPCQQLGLGVKGGKRYSVGQTPRQRTERAERLITDQKTAGGTATPDSRLLPAPLRRLLRSARSRVRHQIESGLSCTAWILPNNIEGKLSRRKTQEDATPSGGCCICRGRFFIFRELLSRMTWLLRPTGHSTLDWCWAVVECDNLIG